MQSKQIALVALVAVGVLILILIGVTQQQRIISSTTQQGIISGKLSIGPLCPVEPCPNPQPDIYSSREIILQPKVGNPIRISISTDGTFQAKVNADTYAVDLTNCVFLGCKSILPKVVTVESNKVTRLDVNIDTGIR